VRGMTNRVPPSSTNISEPSVRMKPTAGAACLLPASCAAAHPL
jgi:hypothetical protein